MSETAMSFNDAEVEALLAIMGRAIESHSCAPGTPWRPAFTAWRKLAVANGTLDESEPTDA